MTRQTTVVSICSGIESVTERAKILRCPKCKRRRQHDALHRYDSTLFKCRKCGHTGWTT